MIFEKRSLPQELSDLKIGKELHKRPKGNGKYCIKFSKINSGVSWFPIKNTISSSYILSNVNSSKTYSGEKYNMFIS